MNSSSQTEEIAADPFAADIFAAERKNVEETAAQQADVPREFQWIRRLPKSAPPKIDWSNLLANLPPDFSDELPAHLAETLQNLLDLTPENKIEFLPLVKKEINRAEDFPNSSNASWWLSVGVEQSGAEFAFEIDSAFVVWLVDAMLGEKVSEQIRVRDLTTTETAILEFLSLNLIYEANRALTTPLFKIRSLSTEIPGWLSKAKANFTEGDSILAVNWQIVHGLLPSIVKIYLAPAALENLQVKENALLASPARNHSNLRRFQNRLKDVPLRLPLGETELTIAELASLETGDVVLLETYDLTLFGGNLFGRATLFAGEGESGKISGEILAPDAPSPESFEENAASDDNKLLIRRLNAGVWKFVITDFEEFENSNSFGKFMTETDEKSNDETSAGETNGMAIENLAVTLRVEFGARRLTLAEVADLRENQIIELGIRPTDSVNLLIENRVIGRGELIEIEERLGVRITKLMR